MSYEVNKETQQLIDDLKRGGIEIMRSPMSYWGIKPKKFGSKKELIKECQKMIINNDYTLMSAKKIGDFMKEKLQSNQEWFEEMRKDGKTSFDYFINALGKDKVKEFHDKLALAVAKMEDKKKNESGETKEVKEK